MRKWYNEKLCESETEGNCVWFAGSVGRKQPKKAIEKLELDNDYFSTHRKLFIYTSLFVFVCRLIFICTVKSGMRHFAPRTGSQMPLLQNFQSSWSFWNKFKVLLHKKWQSEVFLKDYSFCIIFLWKILNVSEIFVICWKHRSQISLISSPALLGKIQF